MRVTHTVQDENPRNRQRPRNDAGTCRSAEEPKTKHT